MPDFVVHLIDDDHKACRLLAGVLDDAGFKTCTYGSTLQFLSTAAGEAQGVVVTDVGMPEMSGLDLALRLKALNASNPVILITRHGDVTLAVEAMKAGAVDVLERPFDGKTLVDAVRSALEFSEEPALEAERVRLKGLFDSLSPREHQVLDGVMDGKSNKEIAIDLGISSRTVEVYRANTMSKTGAHRLSELVRMGMLARTAAC